MSDNTSPLKKYQRQPKLYIDLPSKGRYYPPGSLAKSEELAVYSMTASDEILIKTPDALFNGETTVRIIQSCIPDIKNPWQMPVIDLYTCLAAIRLASYGSTLSVTTECTKCKEENAYSVSLQNMIDHLRSATFIENCEHEGFLFDLAPLSLKEVSDISVRNFKIQRQIYQYLPEIKDADERDKETQKLYEDVMNLNVGQVVQHIVKITTDENEEEDDINSIVEFIQNADKGFYAKVQETVVKNNQSFALPKNTCACASCGHEEELVLDLDYSNFFVQYS